VTAQIPAAWATLLAGAALAVAGCGSGEREFDAETAIAELNEAGAGLVLGEPLATTIAGTEVRVISFAGDAGPVDGDGPGSGAVVILEDVAAAQAEFRRCESAVSFVCFRAANVVLRFAGIGASERERITAALRDLQDLDPG
jgi:hypothetical protein